MDTTENNSNSGEETTSSQAASIKINSGDVRDAFQQFETSVSRFLQENQRNHENLNRFMDQPSDKIRSLERKIDDIRRATERNLDLIRSYRH